MKVRMYLKESSIVPWKLSNDTPTLWIWQIIFKLSECGLVLLIHTRFVIVHDDIAEFIYPIISFNNPRLGFNISIRRKIKLINSNSPLYKLQTTIIEVNNNSKIISPRMCVLPIYSINFIRTYVHPDSAFDSHCEASKRREQSKVTFSKIICNTRVIMHRSDDNNNKH